MILATMLVRQDPAYAANTVRWSAPQRLGVDSIYPSEDLALALAEDGHAALGFTHDGLVLALAEPNRRFKRPQHIGSSEGIEAAPLVAVDERGDAVIAWVYNDRQVYSSGEHEYVCCSRLRIATVRADGRVLSQQTLTPDGVNVTLQSLSISASGSTVAIGYDRRLYPESSGQAVPLAPQTQIVVRVARFGKQFGRGAHIGAGGVAFALRALRGPRAAVIYGEQLDAEEQEAIVSTHGEVIATRPVGGEPLDLNGYEGGALVSAAAVDTRGDAAALLDKPNRQDSPESMQIIARHDLSPFSTSTLAVASTDEITRQFCDPTLAIAPTGWMLAAWALCEGAQYSLATIRPYGESTKISPKALPDPLPQRAVLARDDGIAAAIGSQGQAVLVFSAVLDPGIALYALARHSVGHFQRAGVLADSEINTYRPEPQVAIDPHGGGIAVWREGYEEVLVKRFALR